MSVLGWLSERKAKYDQYTATRRETKHTRYVEDQTRKAAEAKARAAALKEEAEVKRYEARIRASEARNKPKAQAQAPKAYVNPFGGGSGGVSPGRAVKKVQKYTNPFGTRVRF